MKLIRLFFLSFTLVGIFFCQEFLKQFFTIFWFFLTIQKFPGTIFHFCLAGKKTKFWVFWQFVQFKKNLLKLFSIFFMDFLLTLYNIFLRFFKKYFMYFSYWFLSFFSFSSFFFFFFFFFLIFLSEKKFSKKFSSGFYE